jgi:hypothetical protein
MVGVPAGLIKQLGKDRCMVTLSTGTERKAQRAACAALVRAGIRDL